MRAKAALIPTAEAWQHYAKQIPSPFAQTRFHQVRFHERRGWTKLAKFLQNMPYLFRN